MSTAARSARLTLRVDAEKWALRAPFHIAGRSWVELDLVTVTLKQNGRSGRGEAAGVFYLGDDVPSMVKRIEAVRTAIEAGLDRESLRQLMPPGGARNAVDSALWDLEAKQAQIPVWQIAGHEPPQALVTAYTLSANVPEAMADAAVKFADARLLKLKVTGESVDQDRISAVRRARPDATLVVDANQAFTRASLDALLPALIAARVTLIEQPFSRRHDALLEGLKLPIPVAADESAQTLADLPNLVGRFDTVNIKLDKCGGLTEALAMARAARELGLGIMVGNMLGTSLAMAPGYLLGQLCTVVDLDGPLFLKADRTPCAQYLDGRIFCPTDVWGAAE